MFTLNRLGLSPSLMRCLSSTNIIGVRLRTLGWAAPAFLITKKNFRKIRGYRDLRMLKAVLLRVFFAFNAIPEVRCRMREIKVYLAGGFIRDGRTW
jgi:hypothetical protein